MPRRELELARIQRRQHGVFTHDQAIAAGFSQSAIETALARDRWISLRRGLYLLNGVEPTWEGLVLGDCLTTGGAASHRCGAALFGATGFRKGRREITVARKQHGSLSGTTVHTSTDLGLATIVVVDGIPVTAPDRLVVDLGGVVPFDQYVGGIEDLIARRLLTWEDAAASLRAHERRGRRGIVAAREFLLERYGEEIDESPLERMFDEFRRAFALPAPESQYEVYDGDDFVMRADFAWVPERVIVEKDSYAWHLNHEAFEADRDKRGEARAIGWNVLELTKRMITTSPARSARRIRRALDAAAPAGAG